MMISTLSLKAYFDPDLAVALGARQQIQYAASDSDGLDRPPIVRAVSGLTMHDSHWYLVQDDASFIAIAKVMPAADTLHAVSIALPASIDGRRQFSEVLHNKHHKLDLESCFVSDASGAPTLYSFGSGSALSRRCLLAIALVSRDVQILDASSLHHQIATALGHLPNIEGAAVVADTLWMFHRGNTGINDAGPAAFGFGWRQTLAHLHGQRPSGPLAAGSSDQPPMTQQVRFDLGAVQGVRFGITDVVRVSDCTIGFLAAAEASANALDDGAVLGATMGVITLQGGQFANMKMAQIPAVRDLGIAKFEGLFVSADDSSLAYVVADPDNTQTPVEIVTLHLSGPWWDSLTET